MCEDTGIRQVTALRESQGACVLDRGEQVGKAGVRLSGRWRPVIGSPVHYPGELDLILKATGLLLQGAGKMWNANERGKNVSMTFWGLKYIVVFVAFSQQLQY